LDFGLGTPTSGPRDARAGDDERFGPVPIQNLKSKIQNEEVFDLLTRLVDQSLVAVEEQEERVRYRVLEPLREYGLEKLAETGESERIRARHAAFFLTTAEEARLKLQGAQLGVWLDRLEAERDNLRAALEWYHSHESGAEMGLRLAGSLRRFWEMRAYRSEGRAWLERFLARAPAPTEARVRALNAAGNIARDMGELPVAQARFDEALTIMRELGDRHGMAEALNNLGLVALGRGDRRGACAFHRESLAIMREVGDRQGVANNLYNLGVLARWEGDDAAARAYWEECCAVDQELGVKGGFVLHTLGQLARDQGDYGEARRLWSQLLMERREIGFDSGPNHLAVFASLDAVEGQPERGAQLWGATFAWHEALGRSLSPALLAAYERDAALLQSALGQEAFAAALAAGRSLTQDEAFRYAMEGTQA
jgi:tetratricopeptide (TPR) repeat protein